ncbi:hypothetical protein NDU88_008655 [Pleurodeles waltl]|uniref:non-specific serine/threonine protein kinase n=1 Tax=Pleurodeles waltl TaxID=8319 RepID=A0AAV7N9H1_PLEWA|nr:hypothetical protein NDU88_008655 [Pleurodeles waltl]
MGGILGPHACHGEVGTDAAEPRSSGPPPLLAAESSLLPGSLPEASVPCGGARQAGSPEAERAVLEQWGAQDHKASMEGPQENPAEYCPGGYHPVKKGEVFNGRYQVMHKVGWGYFSTVWLCHDIPKKRFVAVKVAKSGGKFLEAALDEVTLLQCVNGARKKEGHGDHIIHLMDDFKLIGENGLHILPPRLRS